MSASQPSVRAGLARLCFPFVQLLLKFFTNQLLKNSKTNKLCHLRLCLTGQVSQPGKGAWQRDTGRQGLTLCCCARPMASCRDDTAAVSFICRPLRLTAM